MQRITITGATGFIGKALTMHLLKNGYQVSIISRSRNKAKAIFQSKVNIYEWDYNDLSILINIIEKTDVFINLAGENIAGKLWTQKQKQKILNSRINIGQKITEAIKVAIKKPELLIQASAIGYYGYDTQETCTENTPKGDGFLAHVTTEWEKSTEDINRYGVKKSIIRTGIVMGNQNGIFPKLVKPIFYYLGANFGNGNNWLSWIHLKDQVRAIEFLIENQKLTGIFNLTAPNPLKSKTFNKIIAQNLNRPLWFNIPAVILKLVLGQMARELLLANQKVEPQRLLDAGFIFTFNSAEQAVQALLGKQEDTKN